MSRHLSKDEVSAIARLARIGISPQEAERLAADLAGILAHFAQIQKINTSNTPPSDDVTGLHNVTRPDAARSESLCSTAALISAAPAVHQGQIKVKAVFKP